MNYGFLCLVVATTKMLLRTRKWEGGCSSKTVPMCKLTCPFQGGRRVFGTVFLKKELLLFLLPQVNCSPRVSLYPSFCTLTMALSNVSYRQMEVHSVAEMLDPSRPLVKSQVCLMRNSISFWRCWLVYLFSFCIAQLPLTRPAGPRFVDPEEAEKRKESRAARKAATNDATSKIYTQRLSERKFLKAQVRSKVGQTVDACFFCAGCCCIASFLSVFFQPLSSALSTSLTGRNALQSRRSIAKRSKANGRAGFFCKWFSLLQGSRHGVRVRRRVQVGSLSQRWHPFVEHVQGDVASFPCHWK